MHHFPGTVLWAEHLGSADSDGDRLGAPADLRDVFVDEVEPDDLAVPIARCGVRNGLYDLLPAFDERAERVAIEASLSSPQPAPHNRAPVTNIQSQRRVMSPPPSGLRAESILSPTANFANGRPR
jgi:hypothetical protein